MSIVDRDDTEETFTIVSEMNAHGATVIRASETHATYHVVEYASDEVRSRLADLPAGSAVRLSLSRAGSRSNVWEATRVLPGSAPAATAAVR